MVVPPSSAFDKQKPNMLVASPEKSFYLFIQTNHVVHFAVYIKVITKQIRLADSFVPPDNSFRRDIFVVSTIMTR